MKLKTLTIIRQTPLSGCEKSVIIYERLSEMAVFFYDYLCRKLQQMILASTVYDTLLDAIRKDTRGRSLSIEEFNNLSTIVCHSLFEDYYKKFEENIESSDALGGFKVFEYPISLTANANATAGVGLLPDNYYHLIGQPRTISGSTVRTVDVVSAQEHSIRIQDYLTQPTTTYPMCQIGGINASGKLQIRVYPSTIPDVYIDYFKEPATPYLDYYLNNTNLNYTYMATNVTVSVPLGNTARDGTVGLANVASDTIDWEFSSDDLELIIAKFMTILGITLTDEILVQAGQFVETKKMAK